MQYTISDLAQEFSVTTRTLRFYEEKGLLSPVRLNNTRAYSAADRTRLKLILRGKRIGLSLKESQEIIFMYDDAAGSEQQIDKLLQKIKERREQLTAQQEDIERMLDELTRVEAQCLRALQT